MKRLKEDPNLTKSIEERSKTKIDEELVKDDYTKPKLNERTTKSISRMLFDRIDAQ